MPSIRKDLKHITPADLEALCDDQAREDEQIDFKEAVPFRSDRGGDPWREKRVIADYGRDQLLAAVIGFANSYGGDLVIGIREDGGKPGGAETVVPIDECEELAHRLLQQANACIEPPIPTLYARGIVTDGNKGGVVIVRTSRSRLSPHRLKTTLECYQRVRHETLPMSMRQIQDLTFSVGRGLEQVEKRFAALASAYRRKGHLSPASGRRRFSMSVILVPVSSDCALQRVHGVVDALPNLEQAKARLREGGNEYELILPFRVDPWQPMLRGAHASSEDRDSAARIAVHCDGAITYEFSLQSSEGLDDLRNGFRPTLALFAGWFFGTVVSAMDAANRFRDVAGATAVEYGMEIELFCSHELPIQSLGAKSDDIFYTHAKFPPGVHVFPRYVVGPRETWNQTLGYLWRDFWNALGKSEGQDVFHLL